MLPPASESGTRSTGYKKLQERREYQEEILDGLKGGLAVDRLSLGTWWIESPSLEEIFQHLREML